MSGAYAADNVTWDRISAVVRYVERLIGSPNELPDQPAPGTRVVTIQVTAVPTDDEADPYLALWPAVIQYVDVTKDPETSERYTLGTAVLAVALNGAPLCVGRFYTGRVIAPDPATGKGVVVVDGTEHVEVIRVTGDGYLCPAGGSSGSGGGSGGGSSESALEYPAVVDAWDAALRKWEAGREVRFKEANDSKVSIGRRTLGRYTGRTTDCRNGVDYDVFTGDVGGPVPASGSAAGSWPGDETVDGPGSGGLTGSGQGSAGGGSPCNAIQIPTAWAVVDCKIVATAYVWLIGDVTAYTVNPCPTSGSGG